MKIRLLVSAMAVSMLLAACGGTSSNSSGAAKSSITDETSSIASSEDNTPASSEDNTPASSEERTLPSTFTTNLQFLSKFTYGFANELYQGASDSFAISLPEALSSGSYKVAEGADGSEVASFAGSWMKLSLANDGSYVLSDTQGIGMSETGTWTLSGCKLTVLSDVADAEAVEAVLADAITVAFANPLYQGAGDSFKVSLTDDMLGGSYKVAEDADGSELVVWNGSWMKLSLANDGSYVLSDNVGYNMSEAGTWTLSGGVLSFVSGYAA